MVVVVVVVPDLKRVCVCVLEGGLKGTGAITWLQQPYCSGCRWWWIDSVTLLVVVVAVVVVLSLIHI